MKKGTRWLSRLLAAVMVLTMLPAGGLAAEQTAEAMPTNDSLTVNGVLQTPTVYKINGSNYFKIRDVAAMLNGTGKQFSVGYDGAAKSVTATTGQAYTMTGTELKGAPAGGNKTAELSNDVIYVNGARTGAEVYKIDGSNYFKLRDLGSALGFEVGYSQGQGVSITTAGSGTGTRNDPFLADGTQTITFDESSYVAPARQVKLNCIGTLDGEEASTLAELLGLGLNDSPGPGQEWRFFEFEVEFVSSAGGEDDEFKVGNMVTGDKFFAAGGASANVAQSAPMVSEYNGLLKYGSTKLYPGMSGKYIKGIMVDKDAGDLVLRVPKEGGKSYTWVKCTAEGKGDLIVPTGPGTSYTDPIPADGKTTIAYRPLMVHNEVKNVRVECTGMLTGAAQINWPPRSDPARRPKRARNGGSTSLR